MTHPESPSTRGLTVPFWCVPLTAVLLLWLIGNATAFTHHGSVSFVYSVVSVFLSINLVVSYWEICIYLKRNYVEERSKYWIERGHRGLTSPAMEFLRQRVPLSRVLSPTVISEAFAAYAYYDRSYSDRRTYGFLADVSNGFVTPIPSALLFATYTVPFVPALAVGVLGVMLYWQWVFTSTVYWWSFFVGGGQNRISRKDMYLYVWSTNGVWIVFPLVGLYASITMVIEGSYGVFGFEGA